MRITIAAVGRLKDGGERVLVDRYLKRLTAARTLGLGPVKEIETPESRAATVKARQTDEAQRLLKLVADADQIAALDEHGKAHTSTAFAAWIGARRDDGNRHLAFLIGGPDGHGQEVLTAAGSKISLGAMTLPHGIARALLAEQIYRATTILSGHPYHRE